MLRGVHAGVGKTTCSSCAAIGICTSREYPLYALHGDVPSPSMGICSVRHHLVQRFSSFPPLKSLGSIRQFSSPFSFLSATSYLFDPIRTHSMLLCFICTCCSVPYFSSIPLLCRCSDHGLHFRCFMLLTTFSVIPILQCTIGTTFFLPFHPWFSGRMSPFMCVAMLYPSCVLPCFTYGITYA
jgi:hypothetical protein